MLQAHASWTGARQSAMAAAEVRVEEIGKSAVAADTKVETPEGPMTIRVCAGKSIPVLSRNAEGAVLFRMMQDVRKVAEARPVLRLTLENGAWFRVSPQQVLLRADMKAATAAQIGIGTSLMPAFHYPAGYMYRSDGGAELVSSHSLVVAGIEPAGVADLYALSVHQTGCFFLAAGVLCQAD